MSAPAYWLVLSVFQFDLEESVKERKVEVFMINQPELLSRVTLLLRCQCQIFFFHLCLYTVLIEI